MTTPDHINRAAEVIEHVLSRHGEHGTYLDAARALDAAGLLATPTDDSARHWRNLALNTEAKRLRAEADNARLREGVALIEAIFDPIDYGRGLPSDAVHARNVARNLLNPPTEGELK